MSSWGKHTQCSISKSVGAVECYNDTAIPWKQNCKRQYTVTVEGNIGSGKSTFLNFFKDSDKVEVLTEPVEMWKNIRGFNALDLIYKDPKRWSLTFQSYVQLTMLMNHTKKQTLGVKMLERSMYSANYCFIENLHQSGLMPDVDYAVLNEWFDWMCKNSKLDVDLIVYLRATPEACLARIKERNRSEEAEVPIEYLRSLHELHEDWLIRQTKFTLPAPVLILDASKNLADLRVDLEKRKEEILCGYV